MIYVDYPRSSNFSNDTNLTIEGWELSETSNSTIKVFLDNTEIAVNRYERQDVLNYYPNAYGGAVKNATPGFTTKLSLNNVTAGSHTISIKLYSSFGDLISEVKKVIYVYSNMYFGIDVSSHQGNIDWKSVAASGIDFVIIRLGYGDNISSQDDKKFLENVNGAVSYGIPYGVYLYSYATKLNGTNALNVDSSSVDSEIAHVLRVLSGLNNTQKSQLKLPVFLDMEDDSTMSIGKSALTNMADYFCSNIQNNGYSCGIYANKNWLNNYLDSNYLASKYHIWLAHYTGSYDVLSDYTGLYQIWQYTSDGTLDGIYSSGLDMNISLKKYW